MQPIEWTSCIKVRTIGMQVLIVAQAAQNSQSVVIWPCSSQGIILYVAQPISVPCNYSPPHVHLLSPSMPLHSIRRSKSRVLVVQNNACPCPCVAVYTLVNFILISSFSCAHVQFNYKQ